MPKLEKDNLKDQFTVRIYNQDEQYFKGGKKAYNRFQTGLITYQILFGTA